MTKRDTAAEHRPDPHTNITSPPSTSDHRIALDPLTIMRTALGSNEHRIALSPER